MADYRLYILNLYILSKTLYSNYMILKCKFKDVNF